MKYVLLTILLALSTLISACSNNDGLESIERTQTAIAQTQVALSIGPTQTALARIQATQSAQIAATQTREANPNPVVVRNADWTPVEQDFDGVTMVLVPPGCFMMGSTDYDGDEQPVHEQCFDEPFWIDKYEVTNADYGSIGCEQWSSEPDQPRNCVSWFDAYDFCKIRSGRLPSEAEWEYVARGPDGLIYPWGNDLVANNVVYSSHSSHGNRAASVGSRPGGASWVGAMDMSGNVWEWTSSLYENYPYDEADGRERDTSDSTNVLRVVRGGSFDIGIIGLRSAFRGGNIPDSGFNFLLGFRCARSY